MNASRQTIRSRRAVVLTVMGGVLLVSLSASAQERPRQGSSPPAAPARNAENGKKLYNAIGCWSCHGYSGQGEEGPRLAPNPLPFPAFSRYTRKPTADMPPYSTKVLSDAQLADIYAFLRTITPPRDWKEIPLLNQKDN